MPLNRATLIRISTIDRCLQNHYRRWTIDDLIDACTDALAEYEGRSNRISRRTFQNDLALMRSDRLGYNAPIVVREHKYYETPIRISALPTFPLMMRVLMPSIRRSTSFGNYMVSSVVHLHRHHKQAQRANIPPDRRFGTCYGYGAYRWVSGCRVHRQDI